MNYLIIGASSGIGKELAHLLQEEGHTVYGTYNKNVQDVNGIRYEFLDVLADDIDLSFLEENLDGLVYCPGSINLKPFKSLKPESFIEDFRLQHVGAIKVIQKVLPKLRKSENGSIVLFSSVAVQSGFSFHAQVASSKGAIEGLTRSLAAEFAPHIRVNAIAPSLTQTPLAEKLLSSEDKVKANAERHPLKRVGKTEDIAHMASFLLSEKASWVTGQVIGIDGGMSTIK